MGPASETIGGLDVVQFLIYLLPGYLTLLVWRKLTAPPEYRPTETEVVGSWLIASVPSLIVTLALLQLAWGPEVNLENLRHFLRSPYDFGTYLLVTAVSAVLTSVVADTARSPLLWLANAYRKGRKRTPIGDSPSVWAQVAGENIRTQAEIVLPDGRRVRGEISTMNEGNLTRELLMVNCSDREEEWQQGVPDEVYVNVETGQVIPMWKYEARPYGETGAPHRGARSWRRIMQWMKRVFRA